MKFTAKQNYSKSSDTVLGMFCDPSFHQKLQEALGARNIRQLEHSDDGTHFRIQLSYEVDSGDSIPGFAKKVLGETSKVVQTESWDKSSKKGHVSVNVQSLPGTLECDTTLSDTASGCTKTFDWTVTVKIPLIGGKIEKVVAADIEKKSPLEEQAGNKLLAAG